MFPTYADILTSHQDLADRGKGADGIVFMQNKTQSIERHSISVIPGKTTSRMIVETTTNAADLTTPGTPLTPFPPKLL
jgi:hypothetical protein